MTAPAISGRARLDLRPAPGQPGVYVDARGSFYVDDATWDAWTAEQRADTGQRERARVQARARRQRIADADGRRQAERAARALSVDALRCRVADLEFRLRVTEYNLDARDRDVRALARRPAGHDGA